jgi:SAM-dependent methyltransferase
MITNRRLPSEFLQAIRSLDGFYLKEADPILQSGFHGGALRWRQERGPILDAIDGDGDILDVGCANGYLLECLITWAKEKGLTLTPFGLDIGPQLIDLAKRRMPHFADHFWVGNAWDWPAPRKFPYVYALYDCVPVDYLAEYAERLLQRAVAPGGRLILGAYGSRSQNLLPFDIAGFLRTSGLSVAGTASGGEPPLTAFAWIDA